VRDVAEPEFIGPTGYKLPVHEVRGRASGLLTLDRAPEPPTMHADEARLAHQPRHALATGSYAVRTQCGMHTGRSVCLARVRVNRLDLRSEHRVGSSSP